MATWTPEITAGRLLLLEWDGASLGAIRVLADDGTMPNLADLFRKSARMKIEWTGIGNPASAWTTLRSGRPPEEHGVWDDSYLDHRRGWVRPVDLATVPCPFLPELLHACDCDSRAVWVSDGTAAPSIWSQRPASREMLVDQVHKTAGLFKRLTETVQRAAAESEWRLLEVRVQAVAALQHRVWHLLGIDSEVGGIASWGAIVREAFAALDRMLGELGEIADRNAAALTVASPYGFVRSREKITLAELLRRKGLFEVAGGLARTEHRARRCLWRTVRPLLSRRNDRATGGVDYPVRALLPADWRRSRAVALHGDQAALVYLNTPERFGTQTLSTLRAREQALADATGALQEARHPVSGEVLFADVFSTVEKCGSDPLERCWPDVIGLPVRGFQTRHRPDHKRQLLRPDPSLAAIQGGDGLLLMQGRGIEPGERPAVKLTRVAPLLLDLLGAKGAAKPEYSLFQQLPAAGVRCEKAPSYGFESA